jgi:hypothetical protein
MGLVSDGLAGGGARELARVASRLEIIDERVAFNLAKAWEAEEKAAAAESHTVRQTWLDVAKAWRFLAVQPRPPSEL